MKGQQILAFLVVIVVLTTGCDIQTYLTIKNSTGGRVVYSYEVKEFNENIKEVNINLPQETKEKNEVSILMGFGKIWTNQRIAEYADKLNYIRIETEIDTIRFNEKDSIINFLKDNRTGLLRNKIKINVK
jgi:hypothetical protein